MGKGMNEIGASVACQIRNQYPGLITHKEKVEKLAEVMDQLGYYVRNATVAGGCVFHSMANKVLGNCSLDVG